MSRTVFVVTESGTQAQYNPEQVEAMLKSGHLKPDTLYWTEGMNDWRPLQEFQESSGNPAVAAPPAPDLPTGLGREMPTFSGYAGFWRRVVASILDGIVLFFLSFIIGFVIGLVMIPGADNVSAETVDIISGLLGGIVGWLYFALMESSSKQATLGKMAIDLKVTDLDGRRIGFGRATGRHFGKIISGLIFMIGYLMAAFTQRKQALHDMMAGCLVVRE